MFKKLAFITVASLSLFSHAMAQELTIPEMFWISQRWFSWTNTFDIETPTQKMGTINRRFWSLKFDYDYYNYQGDLLATAEMRWLTWGAELDVIDTEGLILGSVEERLNILYPTFQIISTDAKILLTAQMNFWGTAFYLYDPVTKREIGTISRSFFRLKDNWTVAITNPQIFYAKGIDARLFILIAAFQTDFEQWIAAMDREYEIEFYTTMRYASFQIPEPLAESPIESRLAFYREQFADVVSSPEDLEAAESHATLKLAELDLPLTQVEQDITREEIRNQAFNLLFSLLDDPEMPDGEKKAPVSLMDQRLNEEQEIAELAY